MKIHINLNPSKEILSKSKTIGMSFGPQEGTCFLVGSSNETNLCSGRGHCLEGKPLCVCTYYYDPLRDCRTSVYEYYGGEAYLYVTAAYFVGILTILLYTIEILNDYGTRRIFRRNYVFFAKIVAVLYGILLIGGTSLFLQGLKDKSTNLSLYETLLGILALVVFQSIFMISSVYWFELLETAKSLWSKPPREVIWAKRVVMGMSAFLIVIMIAYVIEVALDLTTIFRVIGQVLLIIITALTFAINLVFMIRARLWFQTFDLQASSGKKRHDLIIRKTKVLFLLNFQILFTALGAVCTYFLPSDLPQNILLSKGMILLHGALGSVVIFIFLENGISTNYKGLSHLLDVQHLSSRSSSSLSGRHGAENETSSTRMDSNTEIDNPKSPIPPLSLPLSKVPSFSGEGTGSPSLKTSSD